MTSNARRIALLIGFMIAFMLPKRVDCGYPGAEACGAIVDGRSCTPYVVEPWGFFLIELLVHSNVGFAYSHGDSC